MPSIQDSQQHVQVEDLPKLSGIQCLLKVSVLNGRVVAEIVVISGYSCNTTCLTTCVRFKHSFALGDIKLIFLLS